ncbi:hypothetical protein ACAW74_23825 [Fibrella sp. WM1]|uniref:hypothetical protein n=1 Tax=Fibrella musci TaxID=3242485 RepID=UPI00351FF229
MKTNQRFVALALLAAFMTSSFANAQENQSIFKRKWNPEAKGTAIGAGVGGVAGAIIHKRDRKVGAGVGLAVGAAAGYGVGKIISNKQKRAAAAARAAEQREYAARTAPARQVSTGASSRSVARKATVPAAVAAPVVSQQALAETEMTPAEMTASLTRNGYLLNTSFGEPNTAYPESEYRRKSW